MYIIENIQLSCNYSRIKISGMYNNILSKKQRHKRFLRQKGRHERLVIPCALPEGEIALIELLRIPKEMVQHSV